MIRRRGRASAPEVAVGHPGEGPRAWGLLPHQDEHCQHFRQGRHGPGRRGEKHILPVPVQSSLLWQRSTVVCCWCYVGSALSVCNHLPPSLHTVSASSGALHLLVWNHLSLAHPGSPPCENYAFDSDRPVVSSSTALPIEPSPAPYAGRTLS